MVLNIDSTSPIVRPGDMHALVDAVVAAEPEDETDWLEWKSTLPLTERSGCAALARAILGLANRDPDHAATFAGGCGYVIVGAEPGNIEGVEHLDSEKLDAGLRRYLGDGGPQWSPAYPDLDGKRVLVVKVEPPRQGDPLFAFRAETQDEKGKTIRDGTVFVRKGTRTEPASSADMDRLTARAFSTPKQPADGPPIEVEMSGVVPRIWRPETIQALTDAVARHVDELKDNAGRQDSATSPTGLLNIASALSSDQTYEEWEAEVGEWAKHAWHRALDYVFHEITDHHHGGRTSIAEFGVLVTNTTDRNLTDVQVVIQLPSYCIVYDDAGVEHVDRVAPPRPFGYQKSYADSLYRLTPPLAQVPHLSIASSVTRSTDNDCLEVRFNVGDVRPQDSERLIAAYAFVTVEDEPEPGTPLRVPVTWTATSKDTDGVRSGTTELLADRPLSVDAIVTRGMRFVTDSS